MNNLIDIFLHFWNTICIKISYMDVLGLIDISAYNTDFLGERKKKWIIKLQKIDQRRKAVS